MSSQVSACYEIKFSGRYRGFACVLLNCDRPSHPDWGRLGVMRAAGVDNRWQVPAALLVRQGRNMAPYHRNPQAKLGSENIQYKPQCERGCALGQF